MKCPLVTAVIRHNPMTSFPVKVPAHVYPVLAEIYGGEVSDPEPTKPQESANIDESAEFSRLSRLYGSNDEGRPFVEIAYGSESSKKLQKVMKQGMGIFKDSD